MEQADDVLDEQIAAIIKFIGLRAIRGISYFAVAYLLISVNGYGLAASIYIPVAIGLLGAGSASARIGQMAIALLLVMALLPPSIVTILKASIS